MRSGCILWSLTRFWISPHKKAKRIFWGQMWNLNMTILKPINAKKEKHKKICVWYCTILCLLKKCKWTRRVQTYAVLVSTVYYKQLKGKNQVSGFFHTLITSQTTCCTVSQSQHFDILDQINCTIWTFWTRQILVRDNTYCAL